MAEKVVIIGSGPAGHTAAIYAARAEMSPLLFEGEPPNLPGGQLMTTTDVENYPGFPEGISGPELMDHFRDQSKKYGASIITENVLEVDLSSKPIRLKTSKKEIETHTLIIATGATARRMFVKGEDEFWTKGMSACAVCDGGLPVFRNKILMVIGGGDSAVEEATFLTKFASKVYIVHRRDKLRASKVMADRAIKNEKIEILWNSTLEEVKGGDLIETAVLKDTVSGEVRDVAIGGLFYAIGHTPNTELFKGQLELDKVGYIVTQAKSTLTSVEGVYACGDVQDSIYRQAISAAGTGCMAALDSERYITEKELD
ncbi:MAG: thioredoxin-disulfide reductase [Planctomycetota bacterium]|nr:MAG: thioredoxin-disulfide reductase [Planctomycetota bacterium]